MVESLVGRALIDLSLVSLVIASIIEVAADVRDEPMPQFLSGTLGNLSSSDPATILAVLGIVGFLVGVAYEFVLYSLPGGRIIVGLVAVLAFLFAGGFLISGD